MAKNDAETENELLDAALSYAERGWRVIPLFPREKTPAVEGGCKSAQADGESIARWWGDHPESNVGIATGDGLMVIDLDVDDEKGEDGTVTLRRWEAEHGELPETACANTGRGGTHLYYRCDDNVRCSTNPDAGVDIRCEGGYVMAPPSAHPNGLKYAWELDPDEVGVARADDNVMAFVRHVQPAQARRDTSFRIPRKIEAGHRNDTLMRYAASLQSRGVEDDVILATLDATNKTRCKPPLPDAEVVKIAESVCSRYAKGAARDEPEQVVALTMGSRNGPVQSIDNCCRVLVDDRTLSGRFWYDERAYTKMVTGPLPWDDRPGERPITDADYCNLSIYLEREYKLMSKNKAIDAVTAVASRSRRNLVGEWLDSLKWDGIERMRWLPALYLGAEQDDYTAAVMRMFMLGAVARAYKPGVKFDYMPVLVGPQGIGKSTFARLLAHDDAWFCDNLPTVSGDDAVEKLRGMWIVEMAELLAVKRQRDVEAVKSFVSSTVDTIRPKYARETEQRPRACVFIGTTNDTQFLTDSTGNRRFLPIRCGVRTPLEDVFGKDAQDAFDQAWAEAVHIWKTERPRLVLDARSAQFALDQQEAFLEDDPRVGLIQQYLDDRIAAERQKPTPDMGGLRICVYDLIDNALPESMRGRRESWIVNELHSIMRNRVSGWAPVDTKTGRARCAGYGIQRCYVPAEAAQEA